MKNQQFLYQIIYARAYFLFWNPIVYNALGLSNEMVTADLNRAKLLLIMLQEINKCSNNTH